MNIAQELKRKTDEMLRLQRRDPAKGMVFSGGSADGETPPSYIIPGVEGGARVHRETFEAQQVWLVEHNLGAEPTVTVWRRGATVYGFGVQPFGITCFGGSPGMYEFFREATAIPIIEEIDKDKFSVSWVGLESGRVVCVG